MTLLADGKGVALAAASRFGVASRITKVIRDVAPRFEDRLRSLSIGTRSWEILIHRSVPLPMGLDGSVEYNGPL